jgi:hypothetical protein
MGTALIGTCIEKRGFGFFGLLVHNAQSKNFRKLFREARTEATARGANETGSILSGNQEIGTGRDGQMSESGDRIRS